MRFDWDRFRDSMVSNLLAAPAPEDAGLPQSARALVAAQEPAFDVMATIRALAKGALGGLVGAAAGEAAAVPEVRQAVEQKGQLEVGKLVTSPGFLLAAGALLLGGLILLVKR